MMAAGVFLNTRILAGIPAFMPLFTPTAGIMTYSLYLLHYHVGATAMMALRGLGSGKG